MRVLLVTSFGYPHLGGLAKYMQMLKSSLESRGHYVEVLSLNRSWSHYQLLRQGRRIGRRALEGVIRRSNYRKFRQATAGMPSYIRHIELRRRGLELAARRLGISGFDVIHTQDVNAAMAIAKVRTKAVKHVTTIHGIMAGEAMHAITQQRGMSPRVWRYLYALDHYGAMASDCTIVPAYWLRHTYMQNFRVAPRRLYTVPHGVNATQFLRKSRRSMQTIPPGSAPVIFNGQRLEPYKGHEYMLQALGQMRSSRWRAYIAGSGTRRNALIRMRNRKGLTSRVTFLGARRDIPSLLAASDIVVVPSYVETFGLAVVEAQLAGKPVVGFRTTGVTEIVSHGRTGLLSPYGNTTSLRRNIKRLVDNPGLRRRLGRAGRTRALSRYTLRRMVDNTLRVYRSGTKGSGIIPPDDLLATKVTSQTARARLQKIYRLYCK